MSKKTDKNEPQLERREISDLSLVELKAAAFDLASQRQVIEATYNNVVQAIAEKSKVQEA